MASTQIALQNNATAKAQALMSKAIHLGVGADEIMARMTKGETIEEIIEEQEFILLEAKENAEIEARKKAGKPALLNPIRSDFPAGTQGELAYLNARVAYLEASKERSPAGITFKVSKGGTHRVEKKTGKLKYLPNGSPDLSPGGGLSIYGCGQYPMTPYLRAACQLFSASKVKEAREFLVAHYPEFSQVPGKELTLNDVKSILES